MNLLLFVTKSAFEDFRRNKVRTALTSLGILIGVASVVLLMALGLGLKSFISSQFESLGTNLLIIFPGEVLDESGGFRSGESTGLGQTFDSKDTRTLERVRTLEYIAPVFTRTVKASYGSKSKIGDIFATTPNIFLIRKLEAEEGKLFTEADVKKRAKVVVIGPKIVEKLFDSPEQAVGRNIKLDTQTYKVIGTLKKRVVEVLGDLILIPTFIYHILQLFHSIQIKHFCTSI